MCRSAQIDQAQLAVDDRSVRGQVREGLAHAGQALGVVGAVARVESNGAAVLSDLEAEAIPLGLAQPIGALGRRAARGIEVG